MIGASGGFREQERALTTLVHLSLETQEISGGIMSDARCAMRDAKCSIQDARCAMHDAEKNHIVASCEMICCHAVTLIR